jgi:hypothetical protein
MYDYGGKASTGLTLGTCKFFILASSATSKRVFSATNKIVKTRKQQLNHELLESLDFGVILGYFFLLFFIYGTIERQFLYGTEVKSW